MPFARYSRNRTADVRPVSGRWITISIPEPTPAGKSSAGTKTRSSQFRRHRVLGGESLRKPDTPAAAGWLPLIKTGNSSPRQTGRVSDFRHHW